MTIDQVQQLIEKHFTAVRMLPDDAIQPALYFAGLVALMTLLLPSVLIALY